MEFDQQCKGVGNRWIVDVELSVRQWEKVWWRVGDYLVDSEGLLG